MVLSNRVTGWQGRRLLHGCMVLHMIQELAHMTAMLMPHFLYTSSRRPAVVHSLPSWQGPHLLHLAQDDIALALHSSLIDVRIL